MKYAAVTFYLGEDEEKSRTQLTDTLPQVGDYIQWKDLNGFWRITNIVRQFDQSKNCNPPIYYIYTLFERKLRT